MHSKATVLETAIGHFDKAFRILLVEDDLSWVEKVGNMLHAPVWDISVATSWADLRARPGHSSAFWSCIVAEIGWKTTNGKSGIDVLRSFSHFPAKITLSGLKSMEAAFEATRLGGSKAVFDKSNPEILKLFPKAVAKFAALGFMLKSYCPDHADTLFTLVESGPRNVMEWLETSCMTRRRLEQICGAFLGCSPMEAIQCHRVLTHIQLCAGNPSFPDGDACDHEGVTEKQILTAVKRYPHSPKTLNGKLPIMKESTMGTK